MNQPAYHLRPNKIADRYAFLEAIRRLDRFSIGGLNRYTYFGLGGPFLEDFRLLYEFFPELAMVSIEEKNEIYQRQLFHLPCQTIQLRNDNVSSFIDTNFPIDEKSIFWLDYTKLEYSNFTDFMALLNAVSEDSMIKITLRSDRRDFGFGESEGIKKERAQEFRDQYREIMPDPSSDPPLNLLNLSALLQEMLRISAEEVLPPSADTAKFVPVSSFCYSDGSGMLTLTGIVCDSSSEDRIWSAFDDWEFANLVWSPPIRIDVPVLTTKERLHLQELLPLGSDAGETLRKRLGYLIDKNVGKTERALEQYAAFHRYSPYFLRGVP